jgi:hypothetical protein
LAALVCGSVDPISGDRALTGSGTVQMLNLQQAKDLLDCIYIPVNFMTTLQRSILLPKKFAASPHSTYILVPWDIKLFLILSKSLQNEVHSPHCRR